MPLLSIYNDRGLIEAGVDEAGRGCLAGDVYAAAVILPQDYDNPLLNDSKQLSASKRFKLREEIERDALAWAVGTASVEEILAAIRADIDVHADGAEQSDDITMLGLRFLG